jgi:hypothetical protein
MNRHAGRAPRNLRRDDRRRKTNFLPRTSVVAHAVSRTGVCAIFKKAEGKMPSGQPARTPALQWRGRRRYTGVATVKNNSGYCFLVGGLWGWFPPVDPGNG